MNTYTIPVDLFNQIERIVTLIDEDPEWLMLSIEQIERAHEQVQNLLHSVPAIRGFLDTHDVVHMAKTENGIEITLQDSSNGFIDLLLRPILVDKNP